MISPVSGANAHYPIYTQSTVRPQQPQQSSDPQDTVHLSPAAQKASDVDHDGDSH